MNNSPEKDPTAIDGATTIPPLTPAEERVLRSTIDDRMIFDVPKKTVKRLLALIDQLRANEDTAILDFLERTKRKAWSGEGLRQAARDAMARERPDDTTRAMRNPNGDTWVVGHISHISGRFLAMITQEFGYHEDPLAAVAFCEALNKVEAERPTYAGKTTVWRIERYGPTDELPPIDEPPTVEQVPTPIRRIAFVYSGGQPVAHITCGDDRDYLAGDVASVLRGRFAAHVFEMPSGAFRAGAEIADLIERGTLP
jgi:hypothetical protein